MALKRIGMIPGADDPDLERAEREARLAAALNHPHVVAVFDLVDEDDSSGWSWSTSRARPWPSWSNATGRSATAAAALMGQAADALAEAHADGIVHRDVKPPTSSSPTARPS